MRKKDKNTKYKHDTFINHKQHAWHTPNYLSNQAKVRSSSFLPFEEYGSSGHMNINKKEEWENPAGEGDVLGWTSEPMFERFDIVDDKACAG